MTLIDTASREEAGVAAAAISRFKAEAMMAPDPMAGLGAGGIGIGSNEHFLDKWRQSRDHAEQESKFVGWPFAAIRPIAQTVAGQSFMLAKMPGGAKSADSVCGKLRKNAAREDLLAVPGQGTYLVPKFVAQQLKRPAEGLELFSQHPLLDVLRNPNPLMVTWQLLYSMIGSLELTGWSHLWLTFADGRRVVWPLPTSWVSPIHKDKEGNPKAFAQWAVKPGGTGEPIEVPGDEVVPIHYCNPADLLGAVSPLGAQARAILTDELIQQAQHRIMENSIWPRYAFIAGDIEDPDGDSMGRPLMEQWQRDELFSLLKQMYGGTMQAGEPIILDRLLRDVKELGNKPHEMDFQNSGEITKKRILTGFGTSGYIIGESEPGSRAASAMARHHFANFTINPKIELISQILTAFVAPRLAKGNEKLFLWIDPYEPEDREETRKDVETLVKGKAINRDEMRATLRGSAHLPPLEDGQNVYVGLAEALEPLIPQASKMGGKAKGMSRKSMARAAEVVWLKVQTKAEMAFAKIVEGLFEQQRKSVIANLREMFERSKSPTEGLVDLLFHPADWYEIWGKALAPEVLTLAVRGALDEQILVDQATGKALDPLMELPPEVAGYVRAEVDTIMSRPYWQDIHETTRQQLAATINEGIANGESLHELSVRIGVAPTVPGAEEGVLGMVRNVVRAKMIARTETTGALNAGHQATQTGLFDDGLIEQKEWVSIIDGNTRDTHRAPLNGKRITSDGRLQRGGVPGVRIRATSGCRPRNGQIVVARRSR